ncbi:uncharacterized [Tachysurus ichikawai]
MLSAFFSARLVEQLGDEELPTPRFSFSPLSWSLRRLGAQPKECGLSEMDECMGRMLSAVNMGHPKQSNVGPSHMTGLAAAPKAPQKPT